jgi:hypothetical protein
MENLFVGHNKLISLKGSPYEVDFFNCSYNQLSSLEFSPIKVKNTFSCHHNYLTSLKGGPSKLNLDFYCHDNRLSSLEGCPSEVGREFECYNNLHKFTKEYVLKYCIVERSRIRVNSPI